MNSYINKIAIGTFQKEHNRVLQELQKNPEKAILYIKHRYLTIRWLASCTINNTLISRERYIRLYENNN